MATSEELLKSADLERIAREGALIYQSVKSKHEPVSTGKFLAIDIDSRDQYVASSSAKAVVEARKAHPNKVFYVVKIGFDAAETLANLIVRK